LLDYSTPRQREVLEAVIRLGSGRAAAAELGVDPALPSATLKAVKLRAAKQGYSPDHDMTRTVPEGFNVRGVSTYYDSEGKARGQWVKSSSDQEAREAAILAAVAAMSAEMPRLPPLPAPHIGRAELATVYTLTDCHVGMLAWHREGGADWDLSIAEKTLVGCFEAMIASAPASALGIVNQLGDFLHFDGLAAITPTSGHMLDADGRFGKIVETAIRILRQVIDLALAKHDTVRVIMAEGNHDLASSVWLRKMFAALYEKEPRVTVDDSELPYYCIQFGATMLGFHHGHLRKTDQLPILFAAQFAGIWGATGKRYIHTGHRHHIEEREHAGVVVIQHPTLAARDAYAARGGWISERAASAITYHDEHGEVGRVTVRPEMIA
jgi:hypothetical protein